MNRFVLLFIGIFLLSGIYSFGITPARNVVDFVPGSEISGSFSVVNSENTNLDLVVYAKGDLAEYIYLKENKFTLSSGESSKDIEYSLKLPNELKPGLNSGEIVVTNLPSKGENSEAFVGAAVAISYQVHVNVKFPGKYAQAELNVVGANKGEEVVFVMPIFSRGEHDIVSVKSTFDIYNQFNEKIDSFNSAEISIDSGQRKELVSRWKADVPIGKYLVKAMVVYDGETINLEGFFNVGEQELVLHSIEVRNFRLGEIAKFEEIIENKWSEEIKDVFTEMHIYNSEGKLVSEVKSASYNFEPFSKKAILSYWDSAGVKEGDYRADFFLKYHGKSLQKGLDLDVSKNSIKVSGLTAYAISEDESSEGGDLVFILLVVIGILICVNIFWFVFFRKKLKK